jgi:hypothetical protein
MVTVNPTTAASRQPPPDRAEVARRIAEVTGELAYTARCQGLDTLGYILEMAKLEAENILRGEAP